MASLTIRNLDDPLKKRLRIQAAHNGRSMEEEVRQILRNVLDGGSARNAIEPPPASALRLAPPPETPSSPVPPPDISPRPLDPVLGLDRPMALAADEIASNDRPNTAAPVSMPERSAGATPPLSVEAFTDGLRQRLALLVGVEASERRG